MKLINSVEFIIKKSKFYGYLYECEDENDVKEILEKQREENKKATHIVWAARISSPFFEKAVDDGEPSGTAGRPILNVMQKKDVKNACVVVVRYFGGIKLGAGGLLRAYSNVASMLFK